jgi:hypothetical protein
MPVVGHAERVVARAGGDHAAFLLRGRQAEQRIAGPALLERPRALQVVEFADDPTARDLAQRDRIGTGRNVETAGDATLRRADIGEGYGHGGSVFDPITDRARQPDGFTLAQLQERIDRLPPGEFARKFGDRAFYERAAFIYCRDKLSLRFLQREKLQPGVLEFGPEGCFALDLRDESRAADWLKRNGLAGEDYLCVVPRLRYTPYYRVKNLPRSKSDYEIDALNARTTTTDHAPLRDMIVQWVRRTGLRVVACPEMSYQIETAKEQLIDPLPEDVKRRVIWRDTFWLPDEAASIYARARAVVSVECHSPIIALAVGTPTLHVRQPVDTVKAQMYRDIGVGDWLFEVTETSGDQLWSALQKIHDDLPGARARVRTVMAKVAEIQRTMTETLGRAAKRA